MPHPRSIDDAFDSPPAFYVEAPKPPTDVVAHPSHYTSHPSGIETIEITKHESFLRGNILKYVLRAPYKNREVEDLRKARQYLDWEIARAEGKEGSNGATRQ